MRMSGVEIANADRFRTYMNAGLSGGGFVVTDCGCPTIAYPDPGPYGLPNTDTAPWYDPSRPESAHFAGMLIEDATGLDSPYQDRDVNQGQVGGVLGALRLRPRIVVVRATLYALSQLGLDYGLQWVTSVLSGRHCDAETFCNLGDLFFYAACPDAAQGSDCGGVAVVDETVLDIERTMFTGGLVSGPKITAKHAPAGETLAYQIVFTLATESPYLAGSPVTLIGPVGVTTNAAVAAETWECPGFIDPCPPPVVTTSNRQACADQVEQTCDWNEAGVHGPASWATQTWADTGEATAQEAPCTMTLTRTGDAGIDGCKRPSVRVRFGEATGGYGPVNVQFEVTESQGNLLVALWNPATDQNIPITSLEKPAGSGAYTFAEPTGDAVNALGRGQFRISYNLPAGVDPGTLWLIFHAFGGSIGGIDGPPANETITGITLNYHADDTSGSACCSLDPGQPIITPTFNVPCWTQPASTHRTITTVNNQATTTEQAVQIRLVNGDGSNPTGNLRVAFYDPTLIGLAAGTEPTVGGTWTGGVEEWECNALIGDLYIPEIPAGTTLELDGARRRFIQYPNGQPEASVSADRRVYGGPNRPWQFNTIPPCTQYTVVVFADAANTPAGVTVQVDARDLHLVAGVAA